MPVLTVFAGPNGSGKSSIIRRGEFEGKLNLLEADAIAKRMNPALPEQAAISAGREVLLRAKRYLLGGESFSIETNARRGLDECRGPVGARKRILRQAHLRLCR